MGILGGLLKVIISPITMVFGQVLYGALIKFPLEILNFLNSAFLFLSGSGVDKILFNTSFSDGGIKMNFFSNTSPIQHFYLITFAVAGGLGAIFLVVAVIKTITSQKTGSTHGAITAAGRITGGMFLLTLIPVVVLGFLSMVGALSTLFTGGSNAAPQKSDVATIKSRFIPRVNAMYNFAGNGNSEGTSGTQMKQKPDDIYTIDYDLNTTTGKPSINLTGGKSIEDMNDPSFSFFTTDGVAGIGLLDVNLEFFNLALNARFKTTKFFSSISWLDSYEKTLKSMETLVASENPNDYQVQDQNMKNEVDNLLSSYYALFTTADTGMFVKAEDGSLEWNKATLRQIGDLKNALTLVAPKKDTNLSKTLADLSAALNSKMYNFSDFINANVLFISKFGSQYNLKDLNNESFFDKLSANDMSQTSAIGEYGLSTLMYNFKEVITPSLGLNATLVPTHGESLPIPSSVVKFNDLLAQMNLVLSGDMKIQLVSKTPISVGAIAEQISNFQAGSIVTALYHLASGRTDYNWHETPNKVLGPRIMIGACAIGFAILTLVGICMFAAKRIFDIATLFVISPIFVVWSSVDEGKKLRQWFDLFIARVLSVVVLIIAMRMLDVVLLGFENMLNTPNFNKLHSLDGETAYLWKAIVLAVVALAGLSAVRTVSSQIEGIFGSGGGLEDVPSMVGSVAKGAKSFARGAKKMASKGTRFAGTAKNQSQTRQGISYKSNNTGSRFNGAGNVYMSKVEFKLNKTPENPKPEKNNSNPNIQENKPLKLTYKPDIPKDDSSNAIVKPQKSTSKPEPKKAPPKPANSGKSNSVKPKSEPKTKPKIQKTPKK